MTGCGNTPRPVLHPVVPKLRGPVKCGDIRIERQNGHVVVNQDDAKCIDAALRVCISDRKKLIYANRANVAQMKRAMGKR
ncbi:hypothetical protein Nitsa_1783 [Nitratifractor salsuginis DSM 16511]|uniref:Uncharacterized protein n=1 Tax=Nitratifractor salsuginis (strain DSM 16511 / JCM 12458 / E9I37-1) TaxID=749222 RepID=E6X1N7_NITSE|nr:hypothetical protein Nitsa_1783 [Nitratifractor salsuginis DSM 16511]